MVRSFLQFPLSPLQVGLEMVAAAGLLVHVMIVLRNYSQLPRQIAVHFDLAGRPDGWGPRWGLVAMAVLDASVYALMSVLGRMPHLLSFSPTSAPENTEVSYRLVVTMLGVMKFEMTWVFALLAWKMVQIGKGSARTLGTRLIVGVLVGCVATPLAGIVLASVLR